MIKVINSLISLGSYCEEERYKGWDPYDGLNSKIFQLLPFFKDFSLFRLLVIQIFKRNPINFRKLALVPKEYNSKGIGLFLSGYCTIYKIVTTHPGFAQLLGSTEELKEKITQLSDLLISLQSKGYSGACWGYNFDWQARRLFLFPKNTPTVVATNFCAVALMEAYEVTKNRWYLDVALSSANFIINDLHRTPYKEGFIFSYSPLKGNDTVFNASLLASRLLSYCYKYTGNEEYKLLAQQSVKACCAGQRNNGAWVYGMLPVQNWVDSFHTGYNLDGLIAYQENTGDDSFSSYIEKGYKYYINNFFSSSGRPKYYDDCTYPIDIHCPGQLIISLSRLHKFKENKQLVDKVITWTLMNMQSKQGYFYYQLKKGISSRIPYMRWSNAFMFHALSLYLQESLGGLNNAKD